MADYTDQSVDGLLPGEPLTSAKVIAAFENPVAIAEGAPDAPVTVQGWHGINQTVHGTGDASALIWSHAVDGAVSQVESPVLVNGFEYRLEFLGVRPSGRVSISQTSFLEIGLRLISTGAYTLTHNVVSLASYPGGGNDSWFIRQGGLIVPNTTRLQNVFSVDAGIWYGGESISSSPPTFSDGTALNAGASGTAFSRATADRIDRIRMRATIGTFGGGKILMYKRRVAGSD